MEQEQQPFSNDVPAEPLPGVDEPEPGGTETDGSGGIPRPSKLDEVAGDGSGEPLKPPY